MGNDSGSQTASQCQKRTQTSGPQVQDTCLYPKELSAQEHQPPAQQNNEKTLTGEGQQLPPFTASQPPGQKARVAMCHRPLNNTNARLLKSGFHPTHTVKAGSGAKNHSLTVTFRAGGLPSGENPTFLPIGISESKIHPGAVEMGAASRPGSPSWLESRVCTQLEPWSLDLGPLLRLQAAVCTELCFVQ